jgi:hypothetical protein
VLGLTEGGQVSIDDGGRGAVMAQVDLELAEVFALLQEMRGIGMAQRMDMGGLSDPRGAQSQAEGSLQGSAAHRLGGRGSPQATVALGGKEKAGMPVGAPPFPEQFQGALGQRHEAVAVAFAGPDVQEHALGIDVADFQGERLSQAQAAGIDGREGHPMIQARDLGEDRAHLAGREDDGQFELGRSAGKL